MLAALSVTGTGADGGSLLAAAGVLAAAAHCTHMMTVGPTVLQPRIHASWLLQAPNSQAQEPPQPASSADDRLPHQQWQGQETQWMQGNDHQRERQAGGSMDGLQGAALALVQGDQKAGE